ncbi:MAG: carboxylesterase/lipase family protein [Myxococcales bacterium]|nr:carboxylesterase/lipase family protein [Myxococcales bacterium]
MSVVESTHGRVEGEARGGHHAFLGIPFAKPPVGALRFCAPEPAESWDGIRAAREFGPSAMQAPSPIAGMGADGPQGEDCLYLNVYTPAPDGARRPVLVWIHGGAFIMGSGSGPLYDGKTLAERGDVVVVTLNYRLGSFGYLCLSQHGGNAWGATCNAGQLDQVAALRWVQDNIAAFGGDPGNVTVFGESAGSFAIATMLAMPAAKGLFHRAICQSGASLKLRTDRESRAAASIMDNLGIDHADSQKLQGVPAEKLLEVQMSGAADMLGAFFPAVDGGTLPVQPGDAIASGAAVDVPLMLGSNRDEMNLFLAPMLRENKPMSDERALEHIARGLPQGTQDAAAGLLERYRRSRSAQGLPATNLAVLSAVQGDQRFRIPAIRYAEAYSERQPQTFMYLFKQESPAMRGALRACHALDIPFVFGTLDAPLQDRFAGTGPDVERLSATMMDAWLAFARSGDPSTPELAWKPYDRKSRTTMVLEAHSALADAPLDEERGAWDDVTW